MEGKEMCIKFHLERISTWYIVAYSANYPIEPTLFFWCKNQVPMLFPGLKFEGRYNLCLIIGIVWYMCLFCLVMAASPPPHTHLHNPRRLSPRDVCGSSLVMESLNVS